MWAESWPRPHAQGALFPLWAWAPWCAAYWATTVVRGVGRCAGTEDKITFEDFKKVMDKLQPLHLATAACPWCCTHLARPSFLATLTFATAPYQVMAKQPEAKGSYE